MPLKSESEKARAIILNLLSQGLWYAPHEIYLDIRWKKCDVSADSSSARMRDLRKPQYGRHDLMKRRRAGTDYYEYRISSEHRDKAAA